MDTELFPHQNPLGETTLHCPHHLQGEQRGTRASSISLHSAYDRVLWQLCALGRTAALHILWSQEPRVLCCLVWGAALRPAHPSSPCSKERPMLSIWRRLSLCGASLAAAFEALPPRGGGSSSALAKMTDAQPTYCSQFLQDGFLAAFVRVKLF